MQFFGADVLMASGVSTAYTCSINDLLICARKSCTHSECFFFQLQLRYPYSINTCKHHAIIPKSHLKPEGPLVKIIAHQNQTMCFENLKKYKK